MFVLLIEDDFDLARTLVDFLNSENIECDTRFDGEAGLEAAMSDEYDLILLDLSLPKLDGLSVCETLRINNITCPILMLTARDTISDKVSGLDVGADDYLIKPFDFEELTARMRALYRRSQNVSDVITILDLQISFRQRVATRKNRILKLSPTGWELLEILARNSPNMVTKDKLLRVIWGEQIPDNDNLRAHIFKLRQQIQTSEEHPLLHTLSGKGFVLRE